MELDHIAAHVLSTDAWALHGVSRERLRRGAALGEFVAVHRGWYVAQDVWARLFSEGRQMARALAVGRSGRGGDVALSHTAAVALHGWPLYRYEPRRVHVTGPATGSAWDRAAGVVRHCGEIDGQTETIGGFRVTSAARTVADVIGRLPLPAAVSVADAALRSVAFRGGDSDDPYDVDADAAFRSAVHRCAALRPGARGVIQARWALAFADGRAQLPGESVSRLFLHQLGFAAPRLQVRIPRRVGYYEVDFGLDDLDRWGEFDGRDKYTDPALTAGLDAAAVVLREKAREDEIRGVTGRSFIRWDSTHIDTVESLRLRLAQFGAHPTRLAATMPPGILLPHL